MTTATRSGTLTAAGTTTEAATSITAILCSNKQFDGGARFEFTRRVIGELMNGLTVNCRTKRGSHLAKAMWQRSLVMIQGGPADCGDCSE